MAYYPDGPSTRNYKRRQFKYCNKLRSPCASHEGTWTGWCRIPLSPNPDTSWSSKFHITAVLFPGKETSDTHWIWGWVVPRSFLKICRISHMWRCVAHLKMKTLRSLETSWKNKQSDSLRHEYSFLPCIPSSPKWLLPFVSSQLNFGTDTLCALNCP